MTPTQITPPFLIVLAVMCGLMFSPPSAAAHNDGDTPPVRNCIVPGHAKKRILKNGKEILVNVRPQMEFSKLSPSGKFKIHYDTTGVNRVPRGDANNNAIPDYADSAMKFMDDAYALEITQLGYKPPPDDNEDGNATDVYLVDIGGEPGYSFIGTSYSGIYGLTFPESDVMSGGYTASTSFIFIDNDFSPLDSVTVSTSVPIRRRQVFGGEPYSLLKVTCAHEYHHSVQLGYTRASHPNFNEMTSTWMEFRAYPDVNDYLQYMRLAFLNSQEYFFTNPNNRQNAGYTHAFLLQYLQETGREDAVRTMWELMGRNVNPYKALDSALVLKQSSLAGEWRKILPWLYYTGYRSRNGYFSNAARMPVFDPDNRILEYSRPSFTVNASVYPYQVKLFRCVLPATVSTTSDTADIFITSVDTPEMLLNPDNPRSIDYMVSITEEQQLGAQRMGATNYFLSMRSDKDAAAKDTLFFSGGFGVSALESPYPQPFNLNSDNTLVIPVGDDVPTGVRVGIEIHS
ncbi:MAG: hypothetical protein JNL32_11415, partial [Candidatus Kapabacteria bacterium]|nr:hypothetical protein [Candidatus Kapabacteria bacterium]